MRNTVTQARLKHLLSYNPATGEFTWNKCPDKPKAWNTRWAGKKAGYRGPKSHGYVQICVDGKLYLAHRLAWLYSNGEHPPAHVDHIDGDPSNNALANLRPASCSENLSNMKLKINNTSGEKGVAWDKSKKRWKAHVKKDYRLVYQKSFTTFEEAVVAVRAAREKIHGAFCNHG